MTDKPIKSKAPTRYVLLRGNHYRRGPDGKPIRFTAGAILELEGEELAGLTNKVVTVTEFERMVKRDKETALEASDLAAARERIEQDSRGGDAPTDPEQAERRAVLEHIEARERKSREIEM